MKRKIVPVTIFALVLILATVCHAESIVQLSPHVTIRQNSTNGVFITKDGRVLVIYGDPCGNLKKADMVFFTHNRRDVVWSGRELVGNDAVSIIASHQ
ncbi:unnamed protein product [marine sediment metagenome]|uniref:Uncharacterized protein n=1 Tax=marine sediment metagenome TaxID=412755 RepID=X1UVC0_9ZZZZ